MIVETYLTGDDHRLLVVNGELVADARTPGHVVGDGAQYRARARRHREPGPRRGIGHEKVMTRLGSTRRPT